MDEENLWLERGGGGGGGVKVGDNKVEVGVMKHGVVDLVLEWVARMLGGLELVDPRSSTGADKVDWAS
jgi:hypothetical protein